MGTRVGTSYFVSRAAAIRYYQPYHYPVAAEAVDDMIARREISIGLPPHEPGTIVRLIDGNARYEVEYLDA